MEKLLKINEVSKIVGVTIKTLKIWDNTSKLKSVMRTTGGHRRYSLHSIEKFIGKPLDASKNAFVYCRVSTRKQQESGNLDRQKERLINIAVKSNII